MPKLFARRYTLNAKKGFTLIELLVVIAIIGILATFVVASFTGAQARGRDARRKSDLDAIKKALQIAKNDSPGGTYYPGCTGAVSPCAIPSVALNPDLDPLYIKIMPPDPINTGTSCTGLTYCYRSLATRGGLACNGLYCARAFDITACLENTNEAVGGYVSTDATRCPISSKLYTVTEP